MSTTIYGGNVIGSVRSGVHPVVKFLVFCVVIIVGLFFKGGLVFTHLQQELMENSVAVLNPLYNDWLTPFLRLLVGLMHLPLGSSFCGAM